MTTGELKRCQVHLLLSNRIKNVITCKMNAISRLIVSFMIVIIYVCGTGFSSVDPASEEMLKKLKQDLEKAEAEYELLLQQVERNTPELSEYKAKYKEITDSYWNDNRKEDWNEMYGDNPEEKDYRYEIFREAMAWATQVYQRELIVEGEDEALLKRYFLYEPRREEINTALKINTSDLDEFWLKLKEYVKSHQKELDEKIQLWRKKYPFITNNVWDLAYKEASGQFDIVLYQEAIHELTPRELIEAEDKIKKIKQKLTARFPGWETLSYEFADSTNDMIENEISEIKTDNNVSEIDEEPIIENDASVEMDTNALEIKTLGTTTVSQDKTNKSLPVKVIVVCTILIVIPIYIIFLKNNHNNIKEN